MTKETPEPIEQIVEIAFPPVAEVVIKHPFSGTSLSVEIYGDEIVEIMNRYKKAATVDQVACGALKIAIQKIKDGELCRGKFRQKEN